MGTICYCLYVAFTSADFSIWWLLFWYIFLDTRIIVNWES